MALTGALCYVVHASGWWPEPQAELVARHALAAAR